jgi:pimeloyl-ACP methyl ester carboxylesterase
MTLRGMIAALLISIAFADAAEGSSPPVRRHLLYLHGRIVQDQQNPRPKHPEHGYYELAQIEERFRHEGFVVHSGVRPKNATLSESADATVAQVRRLIRAGVPADRITVVGASMGAAIAQRVAIRLGNREVAFVLIAACPSNNLPLAAAEEGRQPRGRMLSVREATDLPSGGCPDWKPSRTRHLTTQEIVVNTGLRHGFLYRPMPEWVDPVIQWAENAR